MSEIFLLPGEFYFGNEYRTIKTLLGSCVAITMWNSHYQLGGMCHYKLPERLTSQQTELDGSYGEEAILLFLQNMTRYALRPEQMTVGVFGAGDMFSHIVKKHETNIGKQNIRLAHRRLDELGFRISHESLGGDLSRRISLDLDSGAVKVQSLDVRQQKWL